MIPLRHGAIVSALPSPCGAARRTYANGRTYLRQIDPAMKTVKLLAMLRDVAGANELEVALTDGDTVRDLIEAVGAACPALRAKLVTAEGELSTAAQIMLNGRNVKWMQGVDTPIAAADELCLLPMVGGG